MSKYANKQILEHIQKALKSVNVDLISAQKKLIEYSSDTPKAYLYRQLKLRSRLARLQEEAFALYTAVEKDKNDKI